MVDLPQRGIGGDIGVGAVLCSVRDVSCDGVVTVGIYSEPKGKGISTKWVGGHRWEPKHVKKDKTKTEDKGGNKNGE